MICKQCGKDIPGYHSTLCRDCYDMGKNIDYSKSHVCSKCGILKDPRDFYGKTNWCNECLNRTTIEKQRNFKRELREYKGGKCVHCGYSTYDGALDFHHIDPNEKEFQLSSLRVVHINDEIKKELDKCILLCANCHRELHGGLWKL